MSEEEEETIETTIEESQAVYQSVNIPLEEQLSPENAKPTKLNKNGKPRKIMSPEALERLAKAREKANAIRKQNTVKKLEDKVEKLNSETEPILGAKPKKELKPEERFIEDASVVSEDYKERKKKSTKKKTKIVVEQSSDDSDEFEPNDNVVFVKRVSRKKKEPVEPPPVERQQAYEQPPQQPPPKPPMKQQLTPQQMMLRDNYNAMFSGNFINQNGMRRHY